MFVSGFPSLSFPSHPQQQATSFSSLHSLARLPSFPFHPTCLALSNSESTIQVSPTFPLPCCLSIHLPNLYSPACVCTPVWVLAWSVWTQRRRKTHQVGRRWEELLSCKERTPVVLDSGFSIGIQTSVQALSGGSLLQMHMLCNNTDCF